MSDPLQELEKTLKTAGKSLTKPRRLVFLALQHQEPQSFRTIVAALPVIDRVSVYRTVALFEQLGIIQRLNIGWKYKLELSDRFHGHHHHLTCSNCGQVFPLSEDSRLEQRLLELANDQRFLAQSHQIEIRGLCKSCQS